MSATDTTTTETGEEAKKGGKLKLVLMLVVVLAVVAGAAYWFVLKPKGGPQKPDPGAVVSLDAIQINLADQHYLKLGLALQASKSAGEEVDGSKALDAAIGQFSGRSMDELARKDYRERMKKQLEHRLEKSYEGDVIGVYFTDFVTQ